MELLGKGTKLLGKERNVTVRKGKSSGVQGNTGGEE